MKMTSHNNVYTRHNVNLRLNGAVNTEGVAKFVWKSDLNIRGAFGLILIRAISYIVGNAQRNIRPDSNTDVHTIREL